MKRKMKRKYKKIQIFISSIFFSFFPCILLAQISTINNDISAVFQTEKRFYKNIRLKLPENHLLRFGTDISIGNISSRVALNITDEKNNLNLNGSFLKYKFYTSEIGFGKVERNWSFSHNNSLVLSKNSDPFNSLYFKTKSNNPPKYHLLSWVGPWTFEIFNGFTEVDRGPNKSMLLGVRGIVEPIQSFKLEFIQMSQWGGIGHESNLKGLKSALIGNTNEGLDAHINKMAGIGFSYKLPKRLNNFRIYGQAIGEDEAGSLPSCFMHFSGIEWDGTLLSKNLLVSLEKIDTRIGVTKNGFCGKNTAYNNGVYSYTHNGKVIGAMIDSEGTSLELSSLIKINNTLSLESSIHDITINDSNWTSNRLSTHRKRGLVNATSLIWSKNKLNAEIGIIYQNLNLDKVNIKEGASIYFSTSAKF